MLRTLTAVCLLMLLAAATAVAQSASGEVRVALTDGSGAAVAGKVSLTSEAIGYNASVTTDASGHAAIGHLPRGVYRVTASAAGFAAAAETVELRSERPVQVKFALRVAAVATAVDVHDTATMIDPHAVGTAVRVNDRMLESLGSAAPGQAIGRAVSSQPGWLMEANGVLHPRGSEYQVQYLVDGVPFTDNRSPAYAPEIEGDDVGALTIRTGSYPAEIGRKLGGVVEIESKRDLRTGVHGQVNLARGSFDSGDAYTNLQYGWKTGSAGVNAQAARTDRYLDPPVLENFSNRGSIGNVSGRLDQQLGDRDQIGLTLRHEAARFHIPNELVQQSAGQRQQRANSETSGTFSYRHIFSPDALLDVRAMSRESSGDLWSNEESTPIRAEQHRRSRETYLKGALSLHRAGQEFKFGGEATFGALREQFAYQITDPALFPSVVSPQFAFSDRARDREQALFVDDTVNLGAWTLTLGTRLDHYSVLVHETVVSPRVGVARYFKSADLLLHASYDRVFQTPASEGLLLASSPLLAGVSSAALRLPVRPSRGNFYEVGATKLVGREVRVEANYFQRRFTNFADDEVLLNTGVNFPIAFNSARIYGAEARVAVAHWRKLSGFASYSYLVGRATTPVTGGLFIGDEAITDVGAFAITQDQRNTFATRLRYDAAPRLWFAIGGTYGSGLPVEFEGTRADALAAYGPAIVSRVNFERGRVRPSYSLDAAAAVQVVKREHQSVWLQADATNLTNRLNLVNFAGLFSGTAVGTPRVVTASVRFSF